MKRKRTGASAMALASLFATSACSSTPGRDGEHLARLTDAVQTACAGVAEADVGPGLSGLHVLRTAEIRRLPGSRRYIGGAEVVLAREGRAFIEVTRLVECRAAVARATGGPDDPLGVHGATIRVVHDVGDVAVLQIRSRRPEIVREIDRRLDTALPGRARDAPQDAGDYVASPLPDGTRTHPRARRATDFAPPAVGPARGRGSLLGL